MRVPGMLWWMSALGRRSAMSEGRCQAPCLMEMVRWMGPERFRVIQVVRRPSSLQVPSMAMPSGVSREHSVFHAWGTSFSSY